MFLFSGMKSLVIIIRLLCSEHIVDYFISEFINITAFNPEKNGTKSSYSDDLNRCSSSWVSLNKNKKKHFSYYRKPVVNQRNPSMSSNIFKNQMFSLWKHNVLKSIKHFNYKQINILIYSIV